MNPTLSSVPLLAPPGASLPWIELQAARVLFSLHRTRTSREQAAALIVAEQAALLALSERAGPAACSRCVLIKRLRGMEDSSRDWSVFMTLEHLRIVNAGIAGAVALLAQGRRPEQAASTAAVKPSPEVGVEVVPAFAAGCEELARTVAAVADLHTAARYAHPWFGPLDAAGWHAMAGFHMRLHRRQAHAILADRDVPSVG